MPYFLLRLPRISLLGAIFLLYMPVNTPSKAIRFLLCSDTSKFSFTKEFIGDNALPPYAILLYIWGADNKKVTFEDLINGISKDKPGYKKIRFCRE